MANAVEYGAQPFAEQLEFFRDKLNLPTAHWTDIYTKEHDWSFVVAGATRDELLCDLRAAVEKAINQGATLEEFRRDFDRIVEKHGWHGWTGEGSKGGKAWRTRIIYETNIATSYAAGRYQQLQSAPLWRYVHADWVTHPRPEHQAWDGLILPKDEPWWNTHFPPNGWGCRCSVQGIWPDDLGGFGKDTPDAAPPDELVTLEIGQRSALGPRTVTVPAGIDPGFEYTPGAARYKSACPPERPEPPVSGAAGGHGMPNTRPLLPLPPPRIAGADDLLPDDLPPQDYAEAFLGEFGASIGEPVIFEDASGESLVISDELFRDSKGRWKAAKRGRGPWMLLLARALKDPDEIWARMEWNYYTRKATIRRRYVARFQVEDHEGAPTLVVFERGADGWAGTTAFKGGAQRDELAQSEDDWRVGVLVYRRTDKSQAGAPPHTGFFRE